MSDRPDGRSTAPALRAHGRLPSRYVEAAAGLREAHPLAAGRRQAEPPHLLPHVPSDPDATFAELIRAAEWSRQLPGELVDAAGAAEILGCSLQYVGRLVAQGRLPWLPTGLRGGGTPTRVYRRIQVENIARAGRQASTAWRSHRVDGAAP